MLQTDILRSDVDGSGRRNPINITYKFEAMKKQVTLDTLLVVTITLLLAIIGSYVNIRSVLSDHEARLKAVEQSTQTVIQKLDRISDQQTMILIKLEDKQDRGNEKSH